MSIRESLVNVHPKAYQNPNIGQCYVIGGSLLNGRKNRRQLREVANFSLTTIELGRSHSTKYNKNLKKKQDVTLTRWSCSGKPIIVTLMDGRPKGTKMPMKKCKY